MNIKRWNCCLADSQSICFLIRWYIVEKGSVALDISLTVAAVSKEHFRVSVIPHTFEATALGTKRIGDKINIENDIMENMLNVFLKKKVWNKAEITAAEGLRKIC